MPNKDKNKEKESRVNAVKANVKKKADGAAQKVKAKVQKIKDDVKAKKPAAEKNQNAIKDNRLELLFTIVNRNKADYYIDLLQSFEINMQLVAHGHGTATTQMLELFGLTDTDKAVIMGVVQERLLNEVLNTLDEKFNTIKNGKGIAYTVPLTSVIGALIFGFLGNNRMTVKEDK